MLFTVSTVKDTRANIERFVRGNLSSGADHMFVFLDHDGESVDEEVLAYLRAESDVTTVVTDGAYWRGERPNNLNHRQIVNANLVNCLLAPFPTWAQWLVHLDGDECLEIDREALETLPPDVRAVRLAPLESVSQAETPEVTRFKRLLDYEDLALLTSLGVISSPENQEYFSGHVVGKAAFRPALDLSADLHKPRTRAPGRGIPLHRGDFHVLHYESFSVEEFLRKWSVHRTAGAKRMRSSRELVSGAIAAVLRNDNLDAGAKERHLRGIYERHVQDPVDDLLALGLLVTPRPEAHAYGPRPLPEEAERQLDTVLARLVGTQKKRFLPRRGVQAPLTVLTEISGEVAGEDARTAEAINEAVERARATTRENEKQGRHGADGDGEGREADHQRGRRTGQRRPGRREPRAQGEGQRRSHELPRPARQRPLGAQGQRRHESARDRATAVKPAARDRPQASAARGRVGVVRRLARRARRLLARAR